MKKLNAEGLIFADTCQECVNRLSYNIIWAFPRESPLCLKGTHAQDFMVRFSHFFCHHSIIDKAEVQNLKNFIKLIVKSLYIIRFLRILCSRRKCTVSLRVFGKNAMFHTAYSLKTHYSPSSLNMLYIAESAQFYSALLPTTISLTPCFCWNIKFDSAFLPKTLKMLRKRTVTKTTLNLTLRFQR
jgi:hypothetical protein